MKDYYFHALHFCFCIFFPSLFFSLVTSYIFLVKPLISMICWFDLINSYRMVTKSMWLIGGAYTWASCCTGFLKRDWFSPNEPKPYEIISHKWKHNDVFFHHEVTLVGLFLKSRLPVSCSSHLKFFSFITT